MQKTIRFEEIGKPTITIDITLMNDTVLSITGNAYIGSSVGGQIYDYLEEYYSHDCKAQSIIKIWKRWHLNDLRAGNSRQEQYIRYMLKPVGITGYDKVCEKLKLVNLYKHNGYIYGSSWLFEALPDYVIKEIENW